MKAKEIRDDEIRVIGKEEKPKFKGWKWLLLLLVGIIVGVIIWKALPTKTDEIAKESAVDSTEQESYISVPDREKRLSMKMPLARAEETGHGFIEIADSVVNDIPLRLYLPHQVSMSLHLNPIKPNDDPSILFAAQAAFIGEDGGIVGAYVLKGELLARGVSTRGYCAIINDTVTVGVGENSPLFEKAKEEDGFFFRQYPLVDNGILVENKPKGKSIRRALCDRGGEVFVVETLTTESFHDFAQALVDLGVDNAIYLVGSTTYGWAIDAEGHRHEFGDPTKIQKEYRNINYLVMRERP